MVSVRFLHSRGRGDSDLTKAVRHLAKGTREELRLAVAYWGTGAAELIDISKVARRVSVKIICDLCGGSCNPHEIRRILAGETGFPKQTEVIDLPGLHAKTYIADEREAIIGSCNASAAGLGGAAVENEETATLVGDRKTVAAAVAWFDRLLDKGHEVRGIDDPRLVDAIADWEEAQAHRRAAPKLTPLSLLEAHRREPDIGSWLVVIDDGDGLTRGEQRESNRVWMRMPRPGVWDTLYESDPVPQYRPGAVLIYVDASSRRPWVDPVLWEVPTDISYEFPQRHDAVIYAIRQARSRTLPGRIVVRLLADDRKTIGAKVAAWCKKEAEARVVPLGRLVSGE